MPTSNQPQVACRWDAAAAVYTGGVCVDYGNLKIREKHHAAVAASVRLSGRGTLGILLFIAGRGRKAYWKRGVGGEGGGAEPVQ